MSGSTTRLDPLRERLLKPELAWARAVQAAKGSSGLVDSARSCLEEAEIRRQRFERLSQEIDGAPDTLLRRLTAQYLRETVTDGANLSQDLRALVRGGPEVLDLNTLAERAARDRVYWECRAEACLALARRTSRTRSQADLPKVLELARLPGRCARRLEAIGWLAAIDLSACEAARKKDLLRTLLQLTARDEQRWVQPAALAALAALDCEAAHAVASQRLEQPGPGDDFLVRAGIVRLIGLQRRTRWLDVLSLAHGDPSEHVRMLAARVEARAAELERIARLDASHRVRASALIRLANRRSAGAVAALCLAAVRDPHAFVVQTAAEELTRWARRQSAPCPVDVPRALCAAAKRSDLPASARAACRDALVEHAALSELSPAGLSELRAAVQATPIGGSSRVANERLLGWSDSALARGLAVVSRDDFGVGADRSPRALLLHRGERTRFALWRALFELLHPAPDKRQGFAHLVAERLPGALRAPPGGLAEVTATRVPGQRVLAEGRAEWGRELPRVEDLIAQPVLSASTTRIASGSGIAHIVPPATLTRRIIGFVRLLVHYASLAQSRQRAVESSDPLVRDSFAREVLEKTGSAIELWPYAAELTPSPTIDDSVPPAQVGAAALAPLLPLDSSLSPSWDRLRELALPSHDLGLGYLAGYGVLVLGALIARQVFIRRRIAAERRAIPLVVGGWGTRGKSGSERLKAALFQGLGYECLVKTTGCEAMFIHAIPGLPAREVFIYRPYDKATVWEQRSVLSLATRLGVRVFLWECMALQPELVNLLQGQWMRDDLSTITNTYPDHEDLQGPSGLDVAQTIAEFVPQNATTFTTDVQMLPLLKARAAARGSRLVTVPPRAVELIAEDLRARFGHAEHPANIALVAALARHAGVAEDVAIAEMADHVVADLGALKTYPTVSWRGRQLTFTNGMGANDRAATLENWRRAGFEADPARPAAPGWIVTIVNNRADRPARSRVFAGLLVQDIVADRHVLIGSNLAGMQRALDRALGQLIHALSPLRDLPDQPLARKIVTGERLAAAFARLNIRSTDEAGLRQEATRLSVPLPSGALVERLLVPCYPENYETVKQRVSRDLALAGQCEVSPFLVSLIAKRRLVRGLSILAAEPRLNGPKLETEFGAAYRAIFLEGVVCQWDSAISGDQLIEALASLLPPSASARMMGMQNIKGTGLDFVYRWVSVESTTRLCAALRGPDSVAREQARVALMVHDDYGVVDANLARDALREASQQDPENAARFAAAERKLSTLAFTLEARLGTQQALGWRARVAQVTHQTLDFADAIRRRRMAARVLDALAAARISHASAALQMRRIVQRAKPPP
jgi:poly-gamma-glutamate synthase PgsB/CapB